MLHWYINPKIIRGRELKMPGKSRVALSAPTEKPSLIEGLSPCSSKASDKIVSTIKKLTRTETKLVNLRAVNCLGNDNGNVITYNIR